MMENLSKRYVSALQSVSVELLLLAEKSFKNINNAFKIEKFNDIINSPEVKVEEKIALILEVGDVSDKNLVNFINLLSENDRLSLIPTIYENIRYSVAVLNDEFEGNIYSSKKLDDKTVNSLKDGLSKRLSTKLSFKEIITDKELVKVSIDDLGAEISFSHEQFKTQMMNHILKSIN